MRLSRSSLSIAFKSSDNKFDLSFLFYFMFTSACLIPSTYSSDFQLSYSIPMSYYQFASYWSYLAQPAYFCEFLKYEMASNLPFFFGIIELYCLSLTSSNPVKPRSTSSSSKLFLLFFLFIQQSIYYKLYSSKLFSFLNICKQIMVDQDDLPPLEDFQSQIKQIKYNKPKDYGSQDYAKPDTRFLDEEEQKKQLQDINKKVESISINIEKKKQMQLKKQDKGYGGMKKGFLGGGGSTKKKQPQVVQIKANKKVNPLEIKEVQDSMKMNNYLQQTRSEWMNENFLQKVTTNQKINKLFTNPEYMKAIDMFKTNPRQAMAKYGNNKEFMQAFQQFSLMMGNQFQSLANAKK